MTRVLIVRHGQSEWNQVGRWQGQADPPLSGLGRLQARHAALALGTVDAVVASDLQRASETAAILAEELGVGPVSLDPDLRERHAGAWQGLTRVEIERDWPGYLSPPDAPNGLAAAAHAPSVGTPAPPPDVAGDGWVPRRPPGWEPDESVLARAMAALGRVHAAVPGGEALVVAHGGLIYAVEGSLGEPFQRIANLEGRWLEVDGTGPVALGERVVLVEPGELTVPHQL